MYFGKSQYKTCGNPKSFQNKMWSSSLWNSQCFHSQVVIKNWRICSICIDPCCSSHHLNTLLNLLLLLLRQQLFLPIQRAISQFEKNPKTSASGLISCRILNSIRSVWVVIVWHVLMRHKIVRRNTQQWNWCKSEKQKTEATCVRREAP